MPGGLVWFTLASLTPGLPFQAPWEPPRDSYFPAFQGLGWAPQGRGVFNAFPLSRRGISFPQRRFCGAPARHVHRGGQLCLVSGRQLPRDNGLWVSQPESFRTHFGAFPCGAFPLRNRPSCLTTCFWPFFYRFLWGGSGTSPFLPPRGGGFWNHGESLPRRPVWSFPEGASWISYESADSPWGVTSRSRLWGTPVVAPGASAHWGL